MNGYCEGVCESLDEQKHLCKKYGLKLGYCRRSGEIAFTVHEKCDDCLRGKVVKYANKNTWDNPYTGRVWHECGGCRGVVSTKARVCRHCGAVFVDATGIEGDAK